MKKVLWLLLVSVSATTWADEGSSGANHLIHEKSPYLQQHAHNPVDWYPWGPGAFARAKQENKPIFLSIGYSTCHWCHVMERESFSDPAIARLLNENFICIKVDREERPDVDRVYMAFLLSTTGSGGWPMSVWLTPDLKPFYGGTYFPPESSAGWPAFRTVLTRIAGQWKKAPDSVRQESSRVFAALSEDASASARPATLPVADLRNEAFADLRRFFDEKQGGFGPAPKFPQPARLEFLLDVSATSTDPKQRDPALRMVRQTLAAMAAGGIHDQLDGGFHRYATDDRWRVPHFEKMLYDQAQLAGTFLTAWQVTADPGCRDAAEDTLGYVQRQLTDPAGGFYSAEDADSASPTDPAVHREGAFYVWTAAKIETLLGRKNAGVFNFAYGVQPGGNAAPGAENELAGQNVLFRAHSAAECARQFGLTEADARAVLAAAALTLREAREKRPRPLRDDKIITAWNGLMISAFARAAQVFGEPRYATAAERAATFLHENLFDPATGRLARSFRAGVRDERGFAEDYAFLIHGLLDLYEATFDTRWLAWAIQLQEKQNELFWDGANGGYFANAAGDAAVLLRLKEDNDAAEPSPNSVAVRNLARLSGMLHRADWSDLAQRTGRAFAPQLKRDPLVMPQMLASLGWLDGSPQQIIIEGDTPAANRLVAEVWSRFLPRHVLLRIDPASRAFFSSRVPFVAELPETPDHGATAYVCANFACQLPTRDPAVLASQLTRRK